MTILAVRDLVVSYGRIEAVRGVSLEVPVAGIATVIGANGAGKSTLLNAIMGLLPAQGGIAFDGRDLHDVPVEDRVAGGLCLVPERRELFGAMTVEDNLRLDEEANIVLIEAIKDGGVELRLLPPMIVFEEGQTYTPELQQIFYGRKARDESYARTKKL